MLVAALDWAAKGYALIPLYSTNAAGGCSCNGGGPCKQSNPSPGKHPRTKNGLKDASSDPDQIRAWWSKWPDANIGWATGEPSSRFVLDLDGPEAKESLSALELVHGTLPITQTILTGREGGAHLVFRMPDVEVRNSSSKLGPKIDVRGTGGYAILPPSLHASGRRYRLVDDVSPAECSPWVLTLLQKPRPAAPAPQPAPQHDVMDTLLGGPARTDGPATPDGARLAGIVRAATERIRSAPQGTRNETVNRECFSVGGWLDGLGGTVDQVAPALEEAAVAAEQPPTMVRRCLEDGRAQARGRPPENRDDTTWHGSSTSSPKAWDGTATPEGPPAWIAVLKEAVETGSTKALYENDDVLVGVVHPGAHGGEVEALLAQLPHAVKSSLRRAGKAILSARKTARKAPQIQPLPLIVQHGPTWWLLDGDRYLSVISSLAAIEVGRLNPGVDTLVVTENGSRYMTSVEVYGLHGVTARRIVWTYDASGPVWDPESRVLRIPGARVSAGPATYSPRAERWLSLLVPEPQLPKLLDWLATAAMLDRPTSAPQLRGPDSVGKGLLAAALTTWLGGRTDYRHATSEFNAGLIHGPLVVLDEGVAESVPDVFRSLTGSREHQVCEKGRMPEELVGCPRVLTLSNEADPHKLGREELSSHSEHALGRRILVFDVQHGAADYLAELGGFDATSDWTQAHGELVCHLRWLAENRDVEHGRRFLVEGDAAAWVSSAHLRAGVAGDIVQAYQAYKDLEEEGRTSTVNQPHPFHYAPGTSGIVGINVGGLKANWQLLVGDAKVPSHQRLSAALRRLSGQEVPIRPRGSGEDRGPRVYLVSTSKLMSDDAVQADAGPGCPDG